MTRDHKLSVRGAAGDELRDGRGRRPKPPERVALPMGPASGRAEGASGVPHPRYWAG